MSKMKIGLSLGGEQKKTRPLDEIMDADSRIGVAEIDRYTSEFDEDANDGKGAHVRVSNVTPELSIELVCNEGKGYGSQTISQDDMPDSALALQEIIEAGFERPEGDEDEWQTPATVIRSSWKMVFPRKLVLKDGKYVSERDKSQPKDYVSFRTRNGRGAKPVEVHKSELHKVISLLENLPERIEPHTDALWGDYKSLKATEKEAADALAEAEAEANADTDDNASE